MLIRHCWRVGYAATNFADNSCPNAFTPADLRDPRASAGPDAGTGGAQMSYPSSAAIVGNWVCFNMEVLQPLDSAFNYSGAFSSHILWQPFSPLLDAILFWWKLFSGYRTANAFWFGAAVCWLSDAGALLTTEFIIHTQIYYKNAWLCIVPHLSLIYEIALKWPNKTTINMAIVQPGRLGCLKAEQCALINYLNWKPFWPILVQDFLHFPSPSTPTTLFTHLNNSADTRHTFIFITFHTERFYNTLH